MNRKLDFRILYCAVVVATLLSYGGLVHTSAKSAVHQNFAFLNGQWFNGHEFERRTGFSVDGQFTFNRPNRVDQTLDLAGAYLVSPFAEGHNHNLGTGVEEQDRMAIQKYISDGVFYVQIQGNLPLTDEAKRRLSIGEHNSVDVTFAQGSLTATGGHPIPLVENVLLATGYFPGYTKEDLKNHYYFTIDSESDLQKKWPDILGFHPDFIKTFLLFSDEFEQRKNSTDYAGQKGLDPRLLPKIVARAHENHLRVSTHVATAADFHNAIAAGVDEIAHLPSAGRVPISLADAALAAKHHTIVYTTYLNAVPSLIRLQVIKESDVRANEAENLRRLVQNGVVLAVGSDEVNDTSIKEIEYLHGLGVFDNLTLLKMWCEVTPRGIFPKRKIGALQEGYEASFLALQGNPLLDFENVRRIKIRFKQGFLLDSIH